MSNPPAQPPSEPLDPDDGEQDPTGPHDTLSAAGEDVEPDGEDPDPQHDQDRPSSTNYPEDYDPTEGADPDPGEVPGDIPDDE